MNNTRLAVGALALSGASFAGGSESTADAPEAASAFQDTWGPPAGTAIPQLDAEDQHGAQRDLASLTGERGLVVLVNRSAVW